jgi:ATP-dependent helicase YprA (DUF1998 family)
MGTFQMLMPILNTLWLVDGLGHNLDPQPQPCRYDGQVAHEREIPARAARHVMPRAQLAPTTAAALAARGITLGVPENGGGGGDGEAAPAALMNGGLVQGAAGHGRSSGRAGGLFIHQAAAIDALLLARRHVVVATPTASGKSLCYNVPVLEALAADRDACALYLFPTKVRACAALFLRCSCLCARAAWLA